MSAAGSSRFGCFGCFWLSALLAGTVVTSGLLYWMQPAWLQPVLFWQTPPFPQEVVFLPDHLLPDPEPEDPPTLESRAELWHGLAASGVYDPENGLTLETLEGSRVELPPHSIGAAHAVTVTPVASLPPEMSRGEVLPVGPALSLRVADEEHWTFERPIRVSIPYPEDHLPDDLTLRALTVAVWEDTAWRVLPTSIDASSRTLSAEVPHASVIGIGLILKYVAAGTAATIGVGLNTEPGQAILKLLMSEVDATFKTKNFAIHYISYAKDRSGAPLEDHLYLAATTSKARKVSEHPLYIVDLGTYLEEGRAWLPEIHHQVAEPWVDRWDVFVLPLVDSFGITGLGGPVILDNDMRFAADEVVSSHLEFEMRRTAVHELIHVAQDDYFNMVGHYWYGLMAHGLNKHGIKWWMESTAEYLSTDLVTRKMGIEDPKPYYYISQDLACPALGWDSNSNGTNHWYSNAKLLQSMAEKGLDVPLAIRKINEDGHPDEASVNRVLQTLSPRLNLTDYHTLFAREFYHENFFGEKLTGRGTANRIVMLQRQPQFAYLTEEVEGRHVLRPFAETTIADPPVVSKLFPFRASRVPQEREARLVVQVEVPPGANDIVVHAVGLPSMPPYRGQPKPMQTYRPAPSVTFMSPGVMAADTSKPDHFELFNVILTHGSFATDDAPITIRRWLLMAPVWVASGPTSLGGIGVSWHESELKAAGDGAAFAGYNVYRRPYGMTNFPEEPLNPQPITDEFYLDTTAGTGLFDYTVRVVDIAGNLSEAAPVGPAKDPFVGTWSGRMRLVEGSLAELAARVLRAEISAAGPVSGGDAAAVEGLLATVRAGVGFVDMMLRFGLPMTVEIRRDRSAYIMKPLTVLGRPVEDDDELRLDRLGLYTLGRLPTTPQGNAVILSLSDWDRIKRTFRDTFDDPELGTMRFGMSIDFTRTQGPGIKTDRP
jgi:hypothetical protein